MSAALALVELAGDRLVTDSRRVAEHFGRRHDTVLRAVRLLDCSAEFNARNFAAVEYIDEKGERRRMYQITKDGFMFLAMGFRGKEAARIKEAYIAAFNAMEEAIRRHHQGLWGEMHKLIAHEVDSKVRASFGSHLMLKRRRDLPFFRRERARLEARIQQPLFGPMQAPDGAKQ